MEIIHCAVCNSRLDAPLYKSQSDRSLTSLCRIHPVATSVYACGVCGHLQTQALSDVDAYYDAQYDILIDSEEEDQIYEVRDGKPFYRTQHQVKVLLEKLGLKRDVNLLDYGCAKSSTIRALCATSSLVKPHLFDVSARYVPFWEKFVHPDHWAVNDIKPEWHSHFDIVTSFFSLEHIPAVAATMRTIAGLLKPGGKFYGVVPDVFGNIADFIVVDHCNHFTALSIKRLLADAGLELLEIDERAHRGALVIVARRSSTTVVSTSTISIQGIEQTHTGLQRLADYWQGAASKVRAYEATLAGKHKIAIYGAGFYGAFISANLAYPERVDCHLDQNPYLQGREFNARPILSPNALPMDIDTILVGINPAHAKAIMADIPSLTQRNLNYFYL
ncbi:Methyltransferase domain-containing protein [Dyella sp. OK004]|uniref:class I SAM-dependent methyltransferase n=1 Tax=Dyella sp. OK004 TaxID=1855292 RepID=UPI0008EE6915|nr:class I SAM-dependent methyltransferase [Dyella sp. OK004]SFS05895.1 Methyltransferase domain-containing protein [Dyella sp. OK004]